MVEPAPSSTKIFALPAPVTFGAILDLRLLLLPFVLIPVKGAARVLRPFKDDEEVGMLVIEIGNDIGVERFLEVLVGEKVAAGGLQRRSARFWLR